MRRNTHPSFETVRAAPIEAMGWNDGIEPCRDALYVELTGETVEEVMPATRVLGWQAWAQPSCYASSPTCWETEIG